MLRQIFRNRGAYNFVNVPAVASQDDPYNGRDLNGDWRRQYSSAQQEYREDVAWLFGPDFVPYAIPITPSPVYQPYYTTPVSPYPTASTCYAVEGWDRPNWWQDRQLSSSAAGNILKKRLEVFGPQREKSLQEVFSRISSEKDAQQALKTAELFRRHRSSREQHTPFKSATSKMIIQRALEVDARDVVVKALERKDELGFNFVSLKAYRLAITHFSTKGDLENVFKVFALARKQGMRPNRDIAFCILRACLDCNRADLAHAYALEFQENGLRVSPAQKVLIEAGSGKKIPAFRGEESDHAYEPIQFQVSDSEDEIIEEADRIIAAAESDTETEVKSKKVERVPEENTSPKIAAEPSPSEAVASEPENKVASEAATAPISGTASSKIVALAAVESATPEELDLISVPGLENAVRDKMRKLFPPKAHSEESSLRRANSM